MPSTQAPNVGLNYGWDRGESGWNLENDENLRALDALLFLTVASMDTDIPSSPSAGDRYIVPSGATGDWDGHDGKVARYDGSAWELYTPRDGWIAYVEDIQTNKKHNGSSWGASVSTTTGESRGGQTDIYLEKSGTTLRFRTLQAGDNVSFDTSTDSDVIKINASASGDGGGISDAPDDGNAYVRKNLGWSVGITRSGDRITNVRETTQAVTSGTVNANDGALVTMTLSANDDLNVQNLSDGQYVRLRIKGGDQHTLNWSTNHTILWANGNVPELTADHVVLIEQDGSDTLGYDIGEVS